MKKIITLVAAVCLVAGCLFCNQAIAQAPGKFSYQAVVRNSSQGLLQNTTCGIKISIHSATPTGTVVYSETHSATSNINGLVTFEVGTGTVTSGVFNNISWGTNSFFIQTQIDPAGGTNYSINGTSQLLSVPYALNAANGNWTKSGNTISNSNTGNVGIGTTSPSRPLTVFASGAGFCQTDGNVDVGTYVNNVAGWVGTNSNHPLNFYTNNSAAQMTLLNGKLGINNTNPSVPLQVSTSSSTLSPGTFAWYSASASPGFHPGPAQVVDISIWADSRVVADEFNAFSDARIKKVIDRSNSAQDLAALLNLKITNYTFIDKATKGDRIMKKVIAQEVEKVLPNAVNKTVGVIPDMYTMAQIDNGFIELKNALKPGDKVQIVFDNGKRLVTVLEATPSVFKVDASETGTVFVYGKEVDDFRTVDYEALSTLNISATQELAKQNELLKLNLLKVEKENETIKASLDQLKAQLQTLSAKVNVPVQIITGQIRTN